MQDKDHDATANFLSYLISKIRADPKETPIMITDQNQENEDKEKLIEFCFETLNAPAFFTCKKGILSLFANGRSTGFVFESGADNTEVMPISDGYILTKGLSSKQLAGETITKSVLDFMDGRAEAGQVNPYFDHKFSIGEDGLRHGSLQKLDGVRSSVREFFRMRVAREAKETMISVKNDSDEM